MECVNGVLEEWEKEGVLKESLHPLKESREYHSLSFMGVILLEEVHRRIDIKYYPLSQWPFSRLYFTGSALFNRTLRLHAHSLGLSLSDHGLYPVTRQGNKSSRVAKSLVCADE